MESAELLRKRRAARQQWYELDDPARRALLLRRPVRLLMSTWSKGITAEMVPGIVEQCVVDWRGFTEADLLGAALASDDLQPFDAAVFKDWSEDEPQIFNPVAERIFELIKQDFDTRSTAEKKPSPT